MARKSARLAVVASYNRLGNKAAVARELGLARSTVVEHLQRHGGDDRRSGADGRVSTFKHEVRSLPARGKVKRYLLTAAQNNTNLHTRFWANLTALARHHDAEILVSRYTYNKHAYDRGDVKPGMEANECEAFWYDPRITPHVCDSRVMLAPDLAFAGELNILPTAIRPLSGLETYTGKASMIVPHAKLSMVSVPAMGKSPAKLTYTTGAVTLRNYIAKKMGQRAEFHHAYAALLVEVDHDGDWFVRQLNATDDGTIYDLDLRVQKGRVAKGRWVEAAQWGDVHVAQLEPEIRQGIWGEGGILDQLRPRYQFFHDTLDFRNRNHHETDDPHKTFALHVAGSESVSAELQDVAAFLDEACRPWCESVLVASNHDAAFKKWLRIGDYRKDHVNSLFFLEAQLEQYRAIAEKRKRFSVFEWALRKMGCPEKMRFLEPDESFVIKGIECGMHGHLGPNGFRGSPANLTRLGCKANIGHSHSAGILDGLYVAGVTGRMRMGYNAGPSSWSRSHIVTYVSGKRTIITQRGEKWRAK